MCALLQVHRDHDREVSAGHAVLASLGFGEGDAAEIGQEAVTGGEADVAREATKESILDGRFMNGTRPCRPSLYVRSQYKQPGKLPTGHMGKPPEAWG